MFEKLFSMPASESVFVGHPKCYLGAVVPGKKIRKSLGLLSMVTKKIHDNINEEMPLLISRFMDRVEQAGGNAVINFRFETGSYSHSSGWSISYLLLYGEGVILDEE